MKKTILNLKGAKKLSNSELKSLNGGNNNCYATWGACDEHSSTFHMFELCMYFSGCGPDPR